MQLFQQILRPRIVKILLKNTGKLAVSARGGKDDLKALCHVVKVEILIIGHALFGVRPGRPDPDDIGQDRNSTDVIENRDPLVALLDIEAVHKFIDFDGIPDPLFHLRIVQIAPFGGKFRILSNQGHEVGGKGVLATCRPGSDHHIQRDFRQSQADLRHTVHIADHFLQGRKIGVLSSHKPSPVFTLTKFFCSAVIRDHIRSDDLLFIHKYLHTSSLENGAQYLTTSPSDPNQERW